MQQILLGKGASLRLTNHSPSASRIGAGTVVASYNLNNTGTATGTLTPGGAGGGTYVGEWLSGGNPADYSARWTTTSGSLTSGTAGSFLNLGTTRSWTRDQGAGIGTSTVVGTVDIQHDASGAIVATATITISAERA